MPALREGKKPVNNKVRSAFVPAFDAAFQFFPTDFELREFSGEPVGGRRMEQLFANKNGIASILIPGFIPVRFDPCVDFFEERIGIVFPMCFNRQNFGTAFQVFDHIPFAAFNIDAQKIDGSVVYL